MITKHPDILPNKQQNINNKKKKGRKYSSTKNKTSNLKCLAHNAFVHCENTGKKDRNICRTSTKGCNQIKLNSEFPSLA